MPSGNWNISCLQGCVLRRQQLAGRLSQLVDRCISFQCVSPLQQLRIDITQ